MARILIAEDSPDIRALVQMLLEADGHDVDAVADGRAAVAAAREAKPDLILIDLSLPVMSGWEAARKIRSDPDSAAIPILAVTAHAMQGDRERALAAGCDGFISKPIDEETFAERVLGFLERPTAPAARLTPESVRGVPARTAPAPGRILVVDDQPEVAELLRSDLEADGNEVVVATSAGEASALFEANGAFDLAVIDVMLGADSGYALTAAITSRAAEYVPVLLVTAGTIDREQGFAAGADDFIGKPVETVELRARARSLIRVGRAVREQGRIGRERAEAYRRLEELDRLKSGFLSTVSHELRTPLNTIILLAHRLEKTPAAARASEPHDRDVRLLREAAEGLRRMIDNILDLAKLEAGQRDLHPEPVALREFLEENANMLEPQAREKGLELVLEVDPAAPATFPLDREKVSRVLVNLLSNAVKYTAAGRVVLAARPWQGSITIEVRDTGTGISPELVGKAFEPFNQIRMSNEGAPRGTGLGLSISKQLVELMGGDLILESREGEGTTVSFTLPALRGQKAAGEAADREPAHRPSVPLVAGRQARVLVVEDDAASRYGLGALLESEGYSVAAADDLDAADEALWSGGCDAIVLDITLPDGDGATWLARRARRAIPTPPVIALTGVASDEDTRRILEAGVRHVLTKPVNVTRLLLALREMLTDSERPAEKDSSTG